MANNEENILLEMSDICKSFPGVKALDNACLTVKKGTVHALMGENGAGKSTLMKCLFGIYKKDSGSIKIEGEEVEFSGPKNAMENGVAMVHQELNQVLKRDVMDNIWLGRYPTKFGLISQRKMYKDTTELFKDLEIDVDPKVIMSTLSVAQRQMVEIAKAVSYNAKLLVLDEPTSSLTSVEVEHLFKIVNRLRARGCGIIYISHKMDEILRISDEVTIMRDGKYISTDAAKDLTIDEIIRKMVGRDLTNVYPPKTNVPGEELLTVKNLTCRYNHVKNVSFSLKKGEVLGFAGLVGAGRTEVLEAIFGMNKKESGEIILNGKTLEIESPDDAIKNKIALLTEERRATGIFAGLSVQEEMEQRLCDALSQMDGVGAVHVVVTLESTGKKIVEKDVPTRSTTEENKKGEETGSVTPSSQDEATVYEKTQNGAETPYVVSEEYPAVRGVLVIAEGGGNPVTIQEIQEAVMALFQVGANKIKVVKMK